MRRWWRREPERNRNQIASRKQWEISIVTNQRKNSTDFFHSLFSFSRCEKDNEDGGCGSGGGGGGGGSWKDVPLRAIISMATKKKANAYWSLMSCIRSVWQLRNSHVPMAHKSLDTRGLLSSFSISPSLSLFCLSMCSSASLPWDIQFPYFCKKLFLPSLSSSRCFFLSLKNVGAVVRNKV